MNKLLVLGALAGVGIGVAKLIRKKKNDTSSTPVENTAAQSA